MKTTLRLSLALGLALAAGQPALADDGTFKVAPQWYLSQQQPDRLVFARYTLERGAPYRMMSLTCTSNRSTDVQLTLFPPPALKAKQAEVAPARERSEHIMILGGQDMDAAPGSIDKTAAYINVNDDGIANVARYMSGSVELSYSLSYELVDDEATGAALKGNGSVGTKMAHGEVAERCLALRREKMR